MADGVRHMTWFPVQQDRLGLFYNRLSANGKPTGEPWGFADSPQAGAQISHPALVVVYGALRLVWKRFTGDRM